MLLAACSDGGSSPFGGPSSTGIGGNTGGTIGGNTEGDANWTILVYLAADNNLEKDAVTDFQEMQAGVSDDVNLLVLMDRAANDDPAGGYSADPIDGVGSFSGVRLVRITPGGVEDLNVRGDTDMTAPQILEQVGTMVFARYPAEHTGVVFWDHGGAWNGFAVDESSGSGSMTPDEIVSGLQKVATDTGIGKFSLVVFDACLMAELEIATALAPVSEYLLASEEVVPNHGMDYSVLASAVTGDVPQFATTMIEGFRQQSDVMGDLATVTMSLLDLAQIGPVNAALEAMQQAVAIDPSASVQFLNAADGANAFGYSPDPNQDQNLRDLGQIAQSLSGRNTSLAGTSGALVEAIKAMVVEHMEGDGHAGSYGVSVYAPLSIENFKTSFNELSSAAIWSKLLDTVYGVGSDFVGNTDTSFVGEPAAQFADGNLAITAQVSAQAAATITSVTVFYGAFVPAQDGFPDLILMLGRQQGSVLDATQGTVGGSMPLLQLGISADGGASGLLGVFSPIPSQDGSQVVISVPVKYMAPGVGVDAGVSGYVALTLDANSNIVGRALYLQAENGTLAQVTPDPAGTIQTIVLQIGRDGSVVPVPSEMYTTPPSLPATIDAYTIVVEARAPGDGSPLGESLGYGVVIVDSGGTEHITFTEYGAGI